MDDLHNLGPFLDGSSRSHLQTKLFGCDPDFDHMFLRKQHWHLVRESTLHLVNVYTDVNRLTIQAILKHVVSRDFIPKSLCMDPILYSAKYKEIYGTVSYQIFPCHFILLFNQLVGHEWVVIMWVTSELLCGSSGSTGVTPFNPSCM